MAIIEESQMLPGILEPYIAIPYLYANKVDIKNCGIGNMYSYDQYMLGVPITDTSPSTAHEIDYSVPNIALFERIKIAQHLTSPMAMLVPQTPQYDVLTDMLMGVYYNIVQCQPDVAYVSLMAFNLMSRMIKDNNVTVGGIEQKVEVAPYEL